MVKTAVLVSGGGTNLAALIDARDSARLPGCQLCAVISSKPGAYALKRAQAAGIPDFVLDASQYKSRKEYSLALCKMLKELSVELVVLAGFMHILHEDFIREFENAVINIHPSLIPSFCGQGFYGLAVHEKALEYGVKISGATVHFVTAGADEGPIILQKSVDILEGDTPEILQKRIMQQAEHVILPKAVSLFCQGRLKVSGRRVSILEPLK